jgi:hypothetical protein
MNEAAWESVRNTVIPFSEIEVKPQMSTDVGKYRKKPILSLSSVICVYRCSSVVPSFPAFQENCMTLIGKYSTDQPESAASGAC